jgi:hypothetical protein
MSSRSLTNIRLTKWWQGMIKLIKEDADKGFEDLEVIDERDALQNLDLT